MTAASCAAAIEVVARGGSMIEPEMVRLLLESEERERDSPLAELTPREREVLAAMAAGKSNAAIADELVLTKRAVEKHVGAIFLKLGLPGEDMVSRRVAAVLLYLANNRGERAPPAGSGVDTTRLTPARAIARLSPLRACVDARHHGTQRHRPAARAGAHGRRPAALPRRRARGGGRDAGVRVAGRGDVRRGRAALVDRLQPDLVLLDVSLPGIDGLETAAASPPCGRRRWSC